MGKIVHLFSRSDVEEYWRCPRGRFWRTVWGGIGLDTKEPGMELVLGKILHEAFHTCVLAQGNEEVVAAMATQAARDIATFWEGRELPGKVVFAEVDRLEYVNEQMRLMEGIVWGWWRYVWPALKDAGRIIGLEQEVLFEIPLPNGHEPLYTNMEPPVVSHQCGPRCHVMALMTTPDLLIEVGGFEDMPPEQGYVEYKTTSYTGKNWFDQWPTAIQFLAAALGVEHHLGTPVDWAMVQGIAKGKWEDGWQHSPFCHGWRIDADGGLTQEDQFSYKYCARKGWYRFPTHEYPGGVRAWVEDMPEEVLANQFPVTQPIYVNREQLETFVRQTLKQEVEIMNATEDLHLGRGCEREIKDRVFPQHWHECQPPVGRRCWAFDLCHQPVVGADPLGSGKFKVREPHHEAEKVWRREHLQGTD